jgi:hypothetical protein
MYVHFMFFGGEGQSTQKFVPWRRLTEAEIPKPGKYDKVVSVSVVAGISERGPTRLEFLPRSWKNEDIARAYRDVLLPDANAMYPSNW